MTELHVNSDESTPSPGERNGPAGEGWRGHSAAPAAHAEPRGCASSVSECDQVYLRAWTGGGAATKASQLRFTPCTHRSCCLCPLKRTGLGLVVSWERRGPALEARRHEGKQCFSGVLGNSTQSAYPEAWRRPAGVQGHRTQWAPGPCPIALLRLLHVFFFFESSCNQPMINHDPDDSCLVKCSGAPLPAKCVRRRNALCLRMKSVPGAWATASLREL